MILKKLYVDFSIFAIVSQINFTFKPYEHINS
jgi:hypothetical protein